MIYDIEEDSNFDNSHLARRRSKPRSHIQNSLKSSFDISTTLELQETPHKQCRICLQADDDSDQNPFIAPCKCIGSVKYVHQKCYRKWIERQYSNKEKKEQIAMLQQGVECQLCKQLIVLEFKHKYGCSSRQKLCQKISKNKSLFLLFLFFIIANSGCLSYLSLYTYQNTNTFKNSLTTMVMIIASFVFLGITLLVTAYYFIADYFVAKVWRLQSFGMGQSQRKNKRGSQMRVHPINSIQQIPE